MSFDSDNISIRKYKPRDRQALRRISYETSFLGKADDLFDEPEILADALTLYFTDSEPESCFVAVKGDKVIGYLIGAKNEKDMAKVSWFKIYPRLFWVAIIRGLFLKQKTFRFLAGVFASYVRGEFAAPDFSQEYPAILHINIAYGCRGSGVGYQLVDAYCQYLMQNGVSSVRASTMSDSARGFFEKCGFSTLFTTHRSYLRYYFQKDIPLIIVGKKF